MNNELKDVIYKIQTSGHLHVLQNYFQLQNEYLTSYEIQECLLAAIESGRDNIVHWITNNRDWIQNKDYPFIIYLYYAIDYGQLSILQHLIECFSEGEERESNLYFNHLIIRSIHQRHFHITDYLLSIPNHIYPTYILKFCESTNVADYFINDDHLISLIKTEEKEEVPNFSDYNIYENYIIEKLRLLTSQGNLLKLKQLYLYGSYNISINKIIDLHNQILTIATRKSHTYILEWLYELGFLSSSIFYDLQISAAKVAIEYKRYDTYQFILSNILLSNSCSQFTCNDQLELLLQVFEHGFVEILKPGEYLYSKLTNDFFNTYGRNIISNAIDQGYIHVLNWLLQCKLFQRVKRIMEEEYSEIYFTWLEKETKEGREKKKRREGEDEEEEEEENCLNWEVVPKTSPSINTTPLNSQLTGLTVYHIFRLVKESWSVAATK